MRTLWGIVCFPFYFVITFFMAGGFIAWHAAREQLEEKRIK